MTSERIAELRRHDAYCQENYRNIGRCAPDCPSERQAAHIAELDEANERLGRALVKARAEIERLRQLVRDAHAWPLGQTVELHAWTDCSCGHDLGYEREYDEMSLMHAAHVEELLNGVTE